MFFVSPPLQQKCRKPSAECRVKDEQFWSRISTQIQYQFTTTVSKFRSTLTATATPVNCWTWKAKIPLKIKIFLWYLKNGVVLSVNKG
jgi:hypothetical protein